MLAYQESYIEQKKQEALLLDVAAHRNGMYVMQAIGAAFSKKVKYPQKPFELKEQEQKQIEDNMSEQDYYEAMRNAIRGMNKQFEEGE